MGQVRIHRFLEKTKRQKGKKVDEGEGSEAGPVSLMQEKLRKRVTTLIKQQKLPAVKQLVNSHDDFRPWGQDIKAKVRNLSCNLYRMVFYLLLLASQGHFPFFFFPGWKSSD